MAFMSSLMFLCIEGRFSNFSSSKVIYVNLYSHYLVT